jgi:hypothetical protein
MPVVRSIINARYDFFGVSHLAKVVERLFWKKSGILNIKTNVFDGKLMATIRGVDRKIK